MLFSIIMAFTIMAQANSQVIEDAYNILLKDNADYKIEESILEEDYELYDGTTVAGLNINGSSASERMATDRSHNQITRLQNQYSYASSTRSSTKYWHGKKEKARKYISINNGTDYNLIAYEDFLKDYDGVISHGEKRFNVSSEVSNDTALLQSFKSLLTVDKRCKNCTEEELKHIGFKAICCLLSDYQKGEPPRAVAARLWRILKIWALVYLCVALPLWCMKGWCCCCLCCKFFKPRQTIEEAKRYFLRNPPGVLRVNRRELQYEPSENERDAYEEFEHLLRTI